MNQPFSHNALIDFLLLAKRGTYAAQGDQASVTPLLNGSRQLEFLYGQWFYRDIYFGFAYFVGQETVYYANMPHWAMGYAGGLLDMNSSPDQIGQVYGFLQTALRQVEPARPYRGPSTITDDVFMYSNETFGDVTAFWGIETIMKGISPIYQLRYHGGFIR